MYAYGAALRCGLFGGVYTGPYSNHGGLAQKEPDFRVIVRNQGWIHKIYDVGCLVVLRQTHGSHPEEVPVLVYLLPAMCIRVYLKHGMYRLVGGRRGTGAFCIWRRHDVGEVVFVGFAR